MPSTRRHPHRRRRLTPLVAIGLLLVALGGCRAPSPPAAAAPTEPPASQGDAVADLGPPGGGVAPEDAGAPATVERVVDGDTLVVRLGGQQDRVRLIGIDTPETKKPDSPVECFGPEAADRLTALTPPGAEVRMLRDVEERDVYDRLLAYVFLPDGDFVNLRLVTEGFATTLSIEPNTAFAPEFSAAEAAARQARLGLWGACPGAGR